MFLFAINMADACGCDVQTGAATREFRWDSGEADCCSSLSGNGTVEVKDGNGKVTMSYAASIVRLQGVCCKPA